MNRHERIAGFDLCRALLLIGGPLVHSVGAGYSTAANIDPRELIASGSHLFRMSAFFALSGYLAALTRSRRFHPWQCHAWMQTKIQQILVPLLTMTVVMLTIDGLSRVLGYNKTSSILYPLHLWFLYSLLVFTYFLPTFLGSNWLNRAANLQRSQQTKLIAFLSLTTLTIFGVVEYGYLLIIRCNASNTIQQVFYVVGETCKYLPMYVFGVAMFQSHEMRALVTQTAVWMVGPALWIASMGYETLVLFGPVNNTISQVLSAALCGLTGVWMTMAVMRAGLLLRHVPPLIDRLSQASYTIYLLHLPIIVLLARGGGANGRYPGINPWIVYFSVATASLIISYAVHVSLVKKIPVVRFLLSGRWQ